MISIRSLCLLLLVLLLSIPSFNNLLAAKSELSRRKENIIKNATLLISGGKIDPRVNYYISSDMGYLNLNKEAISSFLTTTFKGKDGIADVNKIDQELKIEVERIITGGQTLINSYGLLGQGPDEIIQTLLQSQSICQGLARKIILEIKWSLNKTISSKEAKKNGLYFYHLVKAEGLDPSTVYNPERIYLYKIIFDVLNKAQKTNLISNGMVNFLDGHTKEIIFRNESLLWTRNIMKTVLEGYTKYHLDVDSLKTDQESFITDFFTTYLVANYLREEIRYHDLVDPDKYREYGIRKEMVGALSHGPLMLLCTIFENCPKSLTQNIKEKKDELKESLINKFHKGHEDISKAVKSKNKFKYLKIGAAVGGCIVAGATCIVGGTIVSGIVLTMMANPVAIPLIGATTLGGAGVLLVIGGTFGTTTVAAQMKESSAKEMIKKVKNQQDSYISAFSTFSILDTILPKDGPQTDALRPLVEYALENNFSCIANANKDEKTIQSEINSFEAFVSQKYYQEISVDERLKNYKESLVRILKYSKANSLGDIKINIERQFYEQFKKLKNAILEPYFIKFYYSMLNGTPLKKYALDIILNDKNYRELKFIEHKFKKIFYDFEYDLTTHHVESVFFNDGQELSTNYDDVFDAFSNSMDKQKETYLALLKDDLRDIHPKQKDIQSATSQSGIREVINYFQLNDSKNAVDRIGQIQKDYLIYFEERIKDKMLSYSKHDIDTEKLDIFFTSTLYITENIENVFNAISLLNDVTHIEKEKNFSSLEVATYYIFTKYIYNEVLKKNPSAKETTLIPLVHLFKSKEREREINHEPEYINLLSFFKAIVTLNESEVEEWSNFQTRDNPIDILNKFIIEDDLKTSVNQSIRIRNDSPNLWDHFESDLVKNVNDTIAGYAEQYGNDQSLAQNILSLRQSILRLSYIPSRLPDWKIILKKLIYDLDTNRINLERPETIKLDSAQIYLLKNISYNRSLATNIQTYFCTHSVNGKELMRELFDPRLIDLKDAIIPRFQSGDVLIRDGIKLAITENTKGIEAKMVRKFLHEHLHAGIIFNPSSSEDMYELGFTDQGKKSNEGGVASQQLDIKDMYSVDVFRFVLENIFSDLVLETVGGVEALTQIKDNVITSFINNESRQGFKKFLYPTAKDFLRTMIPKKVNKLFKSKFKNNPLDIENIFLSKKNSAKSYLCSEVAAMFSIYWPSLIEQKLITDFHLKQDQIWKKRPDFMTQGTVDPDDLFQQMTKFEKDGIVERISINNVSGYKKQNRLIKK